MRMQYSAAVVAEFKSQMDFNIAAELVQFKNRLNLKSK